MRDERRADCFHPSSLIPHPFPLLASPVRGCQLAEDRQGDREKNEHRMTPVCRSPCLLVSRSPCLDYLPDATCVNCFRSPTRARRRADSEGTSLIALTPEHTAVGAGIVSLVLINHPPWVLMLVRENHVSWRLAGGGFLGSEGVRPEGRFMANTSACV